MPRPTDDEIYDQIDQAQDHDRSLWRGMSYEEGVIAALEWVLNPEQETPMSE